MNLVQLRKEIDLIDEQIIDLFEQRMSISKKVAIEKIHSQTSILNSTREDEIIARVSASVGKELEEYAKTLFHTIFDISRSYQESLQSVMRSQIESTQAKDER